MTKPPLACDAAPNELKACPYCAEPIKIMALKCKHCGEYAHPKKFSQGLTSRLIVIIGLVTAALSLFYALREGYFFIEKKPPFKKEWLSYFYKNRIT